MEENQPKPVNIQEIKPINPRKNYLKISLPLVGMVLLVGAGYLVLNTAQQQTDNRSKASTAGLNYVKNPGCESGTTNWTAYQGTMSRVSGVAHSGSASCRMVYSSGGYYTIDDNPSSVVSPRQGETFTATAWVRTDNAVGKQVQLALRLRGGTTKLVTGPTYTLTSGWQQIQNTVTIDTATRTELEFYIVQLNATSGNSFYADDMTLYLGNGAIPTTVPPSPTLAPTLTKAPTATPTFPPTPAPTAIPTTVPTATKAPTSGPTPTNGPTIMTINKSSYEPGENVTVYWTTITNPTAKDWIGLYTPSAANGDEIGWIYTNCTQTSTTPVASGSCTFPLPPTAPTNFLELRLHPNDTNNVIAKSPTFAVVGPTSTPTPVLMTATPFPTTVPTAVPTVIAQTPMPTATVVPGNTYVNLSLLLHGLGKGGDSVNAGSIGNMSPLHPQKPVTVDVYDVQNQLVVSKTGTITFNATNGNFTGNVELGSQFATGIYTVKIKTEQNLRGLIAGIQTITQGQVTNLPSATLVTGDINNDNQINIVDYNIIVGCYSDLLPAVSCTDINKLRADLTDDGKVNQFDYNLFIRELTNLGGQ